MNDPQFVEAARVLAEQLVRHCGSDIDACIVRAFRLATGHQPKPPELAVLRQLYQEQLNIFAADKTAAEEYLKTGEHATDPDLPAEQVAATAVVASTVMNLDEFVIER